MDVLPDDDTKHGMTGIEQSLIKDHVGAFNQGERGIFLGQVPTDELYAELGRRIKRAESFTDSLEKFVLDYKNKK